MATGEKLEQRIQEYVNAFVHPKLDGIADSLVFFDDLVAWLKERGLIGSGPLVESLATFDPDEENKEYREGYDLFVGWLKMVGAIPHNTVTSAAGIVSDGESTLAEIHLRIPLPRYVLDNPEFEEVLRRWALTPGTTEMETVFDNPNAA